MDNTVKVTIDGREVSVAQGTPLIEAAASAGIRIPYLCYCPGMKSVGSCRLCVVELEGSRTLVASCARQAKDGMVVRTDTPRVEAARRFVVDLLLSNHPKECLSCDKSGSCGLQDAAYGLGIPKTSYPMKDPGYPLDCSNPFIVRDYNLCVLCGLCIRVCESQSQGILSFMSRGMGMKVGTAKDLPLEESGCDFCGSCVSVCPTAALMEKGRQTRGREWAIERAASVCGYCGCGCETVLNRVDGRVVRVESPDPTAFLCARGRFGLDAYEHPERLRKPLIRRDGTLVECEWDEALDVAAAKLRDVRESAGVGSVGVILGANATCETALALGDIAHRALGDARVGSSARPYGFAVLSRLEESFSDLSVVATSDDIEAASVIVVAGADVTADSPAVGAWITRAQQRGATLVALDSRVTGVAKRADVHLRPRAGALGRALALLAKALLDSGGWDQEFVAARTSGIDELRSHLAQAAGGDWEAETGLSADALAEVAASLAGAKGHVVFVVSAETDDSAVIEGVIDLALLSGCAQGCIAPTTITSNVRGHFELLGDEEASDVVGSDATRALFVWDDDPKGRTFSGSELSSKLAALDALVVATSFMSDTAAAADVVLPVASVAETSGTRVSQEGRVRRQSEAPGTDSMSDFEVLSRMATGLGTALPWDKAEACEQAVATVLAAHRETTDPTSHRLTFPAHSAFGDVPEGSADRPTLLVGGTAFHFDDGLVTRHSALTALEIEGDLFGMNSEDMASLGLVEGSTVSVASDAGEVDAVARTLDSLAPGTAFVPRWSSNAKELLGDDPYDPACMPQHTSVHVRVVVVGTVQGGE